ncbi:hypothetical protein [Halorubrum salsamenti]|uniref:hypothetical protein n=1 Tax=Halorubrum salsamenti TaxID=2583990 RepID=UPI0011A5563B|nr:hypothetical protein [Halorubrum salsamenti]
MSPAIALLIPSRRAVGSGLLAGFAHLIVAVALAEWFGLSIGATPLLGYVAAGGLLLGAVPVAIWVGSRLVTPTIVVGGALAASAYGTWSVYVAPVVSPTPVDPTPFGWYLIGWVVVLGAALVAGGAEYGLRRVMAARRE